MMTIERGRTVSPLYIQESNLKKGKREIGEDAVWVLSSAKQGNGVHQLRDNNLETFWQSDGPIPHLVDIQFLKKTKISEISFYLDIKTDESYTPEILSIRGGIHMQNLKEIVAVTLENPQGWITVPLKTTKEDGSIQPFVYTMNLQVAVLQMFHSGKDTHIRQVKIFGVQEGGDRKDGSVNSTDILNFNYCLR